METGELPEDDGIIPKLEVHGRCIDKPGIFLRDEALRRFISPGRDSIVTTNDHAVPRLIQTELPGRVEIADQFGIAGRVGRLSDIHLLAQPLPASGRPRETPVIVRRSREQPPEHACTR